MNPPTLSFSRERRCELLARADAQELLAVAEAAINAGARPIPVVSPKIGTVVLTVREPVCGVRFHLAEVLVTQAEVMVDGVRGWAMRMDDNRPAALAAAICDAEAAAGRPLAGRVDALCWATAGAEARDDLAEWAELAATEVHFEEMDN